MSLAGQRVVAIGGSAGIGFATAKAVVARGARLTIAARDPERLARSRIEIGGEVETATLDATNEADVRAFFEAIGEIDHIVTTAAVINRKPFFEIDLAEAQRAFESKFWGQFNVARHGAPAIRGNGSLTLFSGISSRKGFANLVVTSSINGAIEALCRSLALALAPVRVNAVCPGFVDTEGQEDRTGQRRAVLEEVADALPVKRVGRPDEVARTVIYLMENSFSTGATIDIDGGHLAL